MENPMGNRRQGATPSNLHHVLLGSLESKTSSAKRKRANVGDSKGTVL